MKLKKLIAGTAIRLYKGSQDIEITGLVSNSRLAQPHNLFIAKKGTSCDGARYIEEALAAGVTAILCDHPNPFLKNATQLLHPSPAAIEAELAARFYGYPSQALFTIAITGTNGKTTTSFWVKHLLDALGLPCGLIGTIEYIVGAHHFPAERTTPDAITCQKLLKEMVRQKCSAACMEVSSHGLAQKRVDKIDFDIAIFTNLSHDHLDYHGTFEDYAHTKALLFRSLQKEAVALINSDCPLSPLMVADCSARIFRYGFLPSDDLYAEEITTFSLCTHFTLVYKQEKVRCILPAIGRHNLLNCLAALAPCLIRGIPLERLPPLIATLPKVAGRLERIENRRGLNLFVDYAHTPDALARVLDCLQAIKKGKIITVFGCGGERDKHKRPLMAQAAEERSDFTIVTSDNPRSENPASICAEIVQGFSSLRHQVIEDRRSAIRQAIVMAEDQDLILIAGKGHESYQQFAFQTVPFDDAQVAKEIADQIC